MAGKYKSPTELTEEDLGAATGGGLEMNSWLEAAQAGMMQATPAPRDTASGLPTGKRLHKPISVVTSTYS